MEYQSTKTNFHNSSRSPRYSRRAFSEWILRISVTSPQTRAVQVDSKQERRVNCWSSYDVWKSTTSRAPIFPRTIPNNGHFCAQPRKNCFPHSDEGWRLLVEARQEISSTAFGEDKQEISIAVWRRESNQRARDRGRTTARTRARYGRPRARVRI